MTKIGGAVALILALVVSACTVDVSSEGAGATLVDPDPTPSAAVSSTPVPAQSVAPTTDPEPTQAAEVAPEATASPTAEPDAPDDTAVVIDGGDWVTTERDIAEMMAFIEETHELSFTNEVGVVVSTDIGREFARGFEPFSTDAWLLLRGLGLADTAQDRDDANQLRLDRIRGVCCQFNQITQVAVEIGSSKLATDLIVVHELTHALHTQHPELFADSFGESSETPLPAAAAFEGVPQYVTFEYMKLATEAEQAEVRADLPIIRPDMFSLIGPGPSRHLNFAYATGPEFVDAVLAARGLDGLSDLIGSPPTTTEQVLFPQKYLIGELGRDVSPPSFPAGASPLSSGTIGAAMLMFTMTDGVGQPQAQSLVEGWAGDSYIVFEDAGEFCMLATIEMDTAAQALALAGPLASGIAPAFPSVETVVDGSIVALASCGVG